VKQPVYALPKVMAKIYIQGAWHEKEVEVFSVSFSTGRMRARYTYFCQYYQKDRVAVVDISAALFFEKFGLVEK
jgi:hypothetical protein